MTTPSDPVYPETKPSKFQKNRARNYAAKALRQGILTKSPCERCGENAEMHHEDYNKPLEVNWLCKMHHADRHRQRGDNSRWTRGSKPGTPKVPIPKPVFVFCCPTCAAPIPNAAVISAVASIHGSKSRPGAKGLVRRGCHHEPRIMDTCRKCLKPIRWSAARNTFLLARKKEAK